MAAEPGQSTYAKASPGLSPPRQARAHASPGGTRSDPSQLRLRPIINIHTGALFGYQALPCATARQGAERSLCVDEATSALLSFSETLTGPVPRLLLQAEPAADDNGIDWVETLARVRDTGAFSRVQLMIQIDTRLGLAGRPIEHWLTAVRRTGCVAVTSGFGLGAQDLKHLIAVPPDIVAIAPFFIAGIAKEPKKRALLAALVRLVHGLGIQVLAPAATDAELRACLSAGCDLAFGDAIAPEIVAASSEPLAPPIITHIAAYPAEANRRRGDSDPALIRSQIEELPTLGEQDPMHRVFDHFKRYTEHDLFPVLNQHAQPVGVIREQDLKAYTYSSYGRDLLINPALRKQLVDFLTPCPVVDINASAERILETYASAGQPPGVIIIENFRYRGFLSQGSLLRLVETKKLAAARDQNPLTGLPGNLSINDYLNEIIGASDQDRALVYFDFDNFKPFNDSYGFRHGDRAIVLFAELMRKRCSPESSFIGHIGGDDFFAGLINQTEAAVRAMVGGLLSQFAHEAESLYDPETRTRGYIMAEARDGQRRIQVRLLTCSAAVLLLPAGCHRQATIELVSQRIAKLKKQAKHAADGLALERLTP